MRAGSRPASRRGSRRRRTRPASRRAPRTRSRTARAPRREHSEEHADGDPERGADQRGDDALVPDHPPDLPAGHADRPQHPELAGALEDRQHERVDDAEQAHDHRQAEQHVEDLQELRDLLVRLSLNSSRVSTIARRERARGSSRARRCSPPTGRRAMFRSVRSLSWSANERRTLDARPRLRRTASRPWADR